MHGDDEIVDLDGHGSCSVLQERGLACMAKLHAYAEQESEEHWLFEAFGGAEEKGLSRGWGGGDRDGWVAEGSDGVPRWKEAWIAEMGASTFQLAKKFQPNKIK